MNQTIKLSDSNIELLKSQGHIILNNGIKYYNLPQWFAETEVQGLAQVYYEDQLPESVQLFIREVSIKQALQGFIDIYESDPNYYSAEMKEAYDDAVTALNYEI